MMRMIDQSAESMQFAEIAERSIAFSQMLLCSRKSIMSISIYRSADSMSAFRAYFDARIALANAMISSARADSDALAKSAEALSASMKIISAHLLDQSAMSAEKRSQAQQQDCEFFADDIKRSAKMRSAYADEKYIISAASKKIEELSEQEIAAKIAELSAAKKALAEKMSASAKK